MTGGLLAIVVPPALSGGRFASMKFPIVPVVLIVGACFLYVLGVRRFNRITLRHSWPIYRTVSFIAGLIAISIAIMSFIGVYDDVLFWDHMVQHIILVMVAGPLLAIGSPFALMARATRGSSAHSWIVRILRAPLSRFIGSPLVAFVLYAIVIPISHLTSFYNLTLTNEPAHNFEHLMFVVVGYLFWRQIYGVEPVVHRLHYGMKLIFLFLAVPVDTFTGLALTQTNHEIFPAYLAMHRTWGPSLVEDLHIGGTIMWVFGDSLMTLGMAPVARQWFHAEERRAVRIDRELDRQELERQELNGDSANILPPHEQGIEIHKADSTSNR